MTAGKRVSGYDVKCKRGYAGTRVRHWVRTFYLASLPAYLLTVLPASPLHAQTSLTIYNDGRVLVRRTLPLTLPKGASSQRLALGALDPATLFSLESSV